MTPQQQIKAFFTPEKIKLHRISQIEIEAGIPPTTLRKFLAGVKYRHLTPEQVQKLVPVLKRIGFKLKQ